MALGLISGGNWRITVRVVGELFARGGLGGSRRIADSGTSTPSSLAQKVSVLHGYNQQTYLVQGKRGVDLHYGKVITKCNERRDVNDVLGVVP